MSGQQADTPFFRHSPAWAEIFGDAVAVEAMVDRLIHHSHVHVLKGDSYRLKDKQKEVTAATETT